MAVVDLSTATSYPLIKVISSVGTTQQEINLPPGKLRVSVGSTAALFLATASVADGAAMPTDKLSIPANNLLEIELSHSSIDKISKLAVATQTGTASVEIVLERA